MVTTDEKKLIIVGIVGAQVSNQEEVTNIENILNLNK